MGRNTNDSTVAGHLKGAGACAALFAFASFGAMPVVVPYMARAEARMRTDRLTIDPKGGGGPINFDIEVAASEQEKAVGLMFRTHLGDGQGMLFPYGNERIITMWMRNTYIPLDMLFIRSDGVIDRIEVEAEPHSEAIISSERPVAAVLEIPGGAAGRLGIKVGDLVRHAAFGTLPAR